MTEPRRQYRPHVQAGSRLADAAPEVRAKKKLIPTDLLALLITLLGLVLFDIGFALGEDARRIVQVAGLVVGGAGAVTYLVSLYLKPIPVTLSNGHSVMRPRSRLLLVMVFLLPMVIISLRVTKFDPSILVRRGYQFTAILQKIFRPDFTYMPNVWTPLLDTIKMSLMGSALGSMLALPFSVFASANINRSAVMVSILRIFLNIVRTLPTLIIASVAALIFGLGTFAGTVAITLFTFGVISKMLYESIETIDMGPFQAMESLGASRFQAFWSACMPQILPTYLSHTLYSLEINIRAASILGYVGAGGLGILIAERVGWRDYQSLGTVLLSLFVTVLVIENLSGYLRRKLS